MPDSYLVDSHCHLHDPEFFPSNVAEKMLENAFASKVRQIICIGTSISDSKNACTFAKTHKNVFWTFGIHPEEASSIYDKDDITVDYETIKPIAIGEVGLDYHYENYNKKAQIVLLEQMLDIATRMNLPVCLHVRDAFPDIFGILDNFPNLKGVFHSFSDSESNLKEVLRRDFYIGINGLATFANLSCYKNLKKNIPLEKILLETDAPFLTPVPKRGIINEPAYVKFVASWLSEKLGKNIEEIERRTTENVRNLFNLQNPELL